MKGVVPPPLLPPENKNPSNKGKRPLCVWLLEEPAGAPAVTHIALGSVFVQRLMSTAAGMAETHRQYPSAMTMEGVPQVGMNAGCVWCTCCGQITNLACYF